MIHDKETYMGNHLDMPGILINHHNRMYNNIFQFEEG
jgi:hypothetical protein